MWKIIIVGKVMESQSSGLGHSVKGEILYERITSVYCLNVKE